YFFVYLVSRKRLRKWAKALGKPILVVLASWFLTFNLVSLSCLFEVHTSVTWVRRTMLSVLTGPLWPSALFGQIEWGWVIPTAALAMAVHSLPLGPGRVYDGASGALELEIRGSVYPAKGIASTVSCGRDF